MVSIIIPDYNGERFLEKCILSWQAQTYSDFELILIDDGSKDASLAICQRMASSDARIKVKSIENNGVSHARNVGLAMATGDIIGFSDCDDIVSPIMLEQVMHGFEKEKADNVTVGIKVIDELDDSLLSFTENLEQVTSIWDAKEYQKHVLSDKKVQGFSPTKYWRASLVKDILFDEDIIYCEDLLWILTAVENNPTMRIAYYDLPLYGYVMHGGNATNDMNRYLDEKGQIRYISAYEKILCLLANSPVKDKVESNLFYFALNSFFVSSRMEAETKKKLKGYLKQYKKAYFADQSHTEKERIHMRLCLVRLLLRKVYW